MLCTIIKRCFVLSLSDALYYQHATLYREQYLDTLNKRNYGRFILRVNNK